MTTVYKIGGVTVTTIHSIGVSVERYHTADYWKIRLYVEDAFSPAVTAKCLPNTTLAISIADSYGTTTWTGTLSYWASSTDYSFVDLLNCQLTFVAA